MCCISPSNHLHVLFLSVEDSLVFLAKAGVKTYLEPGSGKTGGAGWDRAARIREIRKSGGFESH